MSRNKYTTVHSWNMQGEGNTKIKNRTPQMRDILLLQETGAPNDKGFMPGNEYNGYRCILSKCDPAAKNKRCTTSILVSKDIEDMVTEKGAYSVTNGKNRVTRPLLYINYEDVYIYTYHATANISSSIAEMKYILRQMYKFKNKYWMIMGDFNVIPTMLCDRMETVNNIKKGAAHVRLLTINFVTTSRPKRFQFYLLSSRRNTQGAGARKRLFDYALVSKAIVEDNICDGYVRNRLQTNSDHNEIGLTINTDKLWN